MRLATTAGTVIYIIMMPISELMGSWARKHKLQFAYFPILLVFVCVLVRPNAIHYFRNTDAFQNKKLPNIAFESLNQEKINFDTEVTVIDLWSTTCGVCFEEFPIFEKLKQEFEGNSKVKFYSANVPLKRDTHEKTLNIIEELDYDYETVFAEKFEMIRDSLEINGFPHLLIVKNDTIRYLGDMETDRKIVLTNTRNVLKNILK
ncbi:TlpA family protein disulfide reductase [Kordia sp.]|uniref:TlpA family protein disulfide reductase n=1 Tax=Kordia sp. TaxID=1965332 RepID=UPI003D2AE1A7